MLNADGVMDENVKHRIALGWLKWRVVSRVLYDKHVLMKLKCKFYIIDILPALLLEYNVMQ